MQWRNNMAEFGTKALGKDTIDRKMNMSRCVRSGSRVRGLTVEKVCQRTPQDDCATSSTLPSDILTRRDRSCLFHIMMPFHTQPCVEGFPVICIHGLRERATMSARETSASQSSNSLHHRLDSALRWSNEYTRVLSGRDHA